MFFYTGYIRCNFGNALKTIALVLVMAIVPSILFGQSLSNDILKEAFRNNQLTHTVKKNYSFTVNLNQVSLHDLDSVLGITKPIEIGLSKKPSISLGFLPVVLRQQYNSALPYGWNNAPMIPAKGYQAVLSAGIYATIGKHISIQLAPELVSAENAPFEQFSQQLGNRAWADYYRFLNTSDIPEQFGVGGYRNFFPGQSSIRYNFRSFSVGISTENMWWGPGSRNALVMSTNAPGFLHFTFNTTKPVKTGIGTFEGQIIGGKLDETGILPPRIFSSYNGAFLYEPKHSEWRYITGMVASWQPKWTPNLYLGIAKASYLYHSTISNPLDILPLQGFFGRVRTEAERSGRKSSMGSLFARYVMPSENAEIYFELGRKDLSLMPWNIVQTDNYRRAYVAGLRKLWPVKKGAYIQMSAEFTQMQAPTAELIRQPDSWYTDRFVRQGYTNEGRVIGAGIGPGSNSQTLEISWVKGVKKIGIQFERVRYNSDFYYYAFEYVRDFRRHWIDISTTLKADWNYKQFFASAQFGIIRTYNYKWLIIQVDPNDFFAAGNEFLNLSGRLSLSYRF